MSSHSNTPTSSSSVALPILGQTTPSSPVFFFWDPESNCLLSSNVPYFPSCGIPRRARHSVNNRFHLPQYYRGSDPARPFYHHSQVFKSSSLLRSLVYVPLKQVEVSAVSSPDCSAIEWISSLVKPWLGLRNFLHACCNALGHEWIQQPEHEERSIAPFDVPSPTVKEAQARVFAERRYLNHLVAIFAYRVYLFEEQHRHNDRTVCHEPSWLTYLMSHSDVSPLVIIGTSGEHQTAADALNELGHMGVTRFLQHNGKSRVGALIDPSSVGACTHIAVYLGAHIPVWFNWKTAQQSYHRYSTAYGGLPPIEFIPPENWRDLAIRISAHPFIRRAQKSVKDCVQTNSC